MLDHCQQYKRRQRTFRGVYFCAIGLPNWSFLSSGPSKPHLWLQRCVEMQNVALPRKSRKTEVTDCKILFTGRQNVKLRRKTSYPWKKAVGAAIFCDFVNKIKTASVLLFQNWKPASCRSRQRGISAAILLLLPSSLMLIWLICGKILLQFSVCYRHICSELEIQFSANLKKQKFVSLVSLLNSSMWDGTFLRCMCACMSLLKCGLVTLLFA